MPGFVPAVSDQLVVGLEAAKAAPAPAKAPAKARAKATTATATRAAPKRAKAQAKAGLLLSLESSWGQANYVARMLSTYDRLVEPREIVAEIDGVTLDAVRAAGARMLAGFEELERLVKLDGGVVYLDLEVHADAHG